jgi:type I restriction enzyme S subunit
MNKIGWPMVALGELLKRVKRHELVEPSKTYDVLGAHWYAKGLYTKHSKPGSQIRAKYVYRVEQGDFVYNRLFAWKGSFAIATQENDGCHVSNEFPCFVIDRERLDGQYLWYYFSRASAWNEALGLSSGGTPTSRNRLKEARLLAMHIPLPPLAEQRRIVARIEELAAKVEAAQALRQQAVEEADALWLSALDTAFRPDAVPTDVKEDASILLARQAKVHAKTFNPRYNRAHPGRPSIYPKGLYQLPPTWVWTDFGTVLTHLVDCVNDTPDFADSPTGLLGLKSTNVRPYELDLSQRWYVTPEDFNGWNRREAPLAGDIILTREAPMGKACILPEGVRVCLTQRLLLLRTDETFVAAKYVLHYINSPHFQNQVLDVCRGLTTPHIRVKDAPRIRMPLAPRREQRRIVNCLDRLQAKVEGVKDHQAATAAALDALLPSILDRAFKGEL